MGMLVVLWYFKIHPSFENLNVNKLIFHIWWLSGKSWVNKLSVIVWGQIAPSGCWTGWAKVGLCTNKGLIQRRGNSSDSKVFAMQAQEPKYNLNITCTNHVRKPHTHRGCMQKTRTLRGCMWKSHTFRACALSILLLGGRDRKTTGAHWPARLISKLQVQPKDPLSTIMPNNIWDCPLVSTHCTHWSTHTQINK